MPQNFAMLGDVVEEALRRKSSAMQRAWPISSAWASASTPARARQRRPRVLGRGQFDLKQLLGGVERAASGQVRHHQLNLLKRKFRVAQRCARQARPAIGFHRQARHVDLLERLACLHIRTIGPARRCRPPGARRPGNAALRP